MAGRYNHVSYLGNWQGEHPFSDRALHSTTVPPDTEWLKAFFSVDPNSAPTLVAEKGYVPNIPFPYYYLAADGWRNTLTDVLWDGVK